MRHVQLRSVQRCGRYHVCEIRKKVVTWGNVRIALQIDVVRQVNRLRWGEDVPVWHSEDLQGFVQHG